MSGFVLFLMAHATLILRPNEIVPQLQGLQLYLPLIALAALCSLDRIQHQLSARMLVEQPVNLCVVGVTLAVGVSHFWLMSVGSGIAGLIMMAKILCYYLILVSVIDTPQRFRVFLMTTAIAGAMMVTYSVWDFHAFNAEWLGRDDLWEVYDADRYRPPEERVLHHVLETHGTTETGEPIAFFRMAGKGIFQDPNDLSLLIAICSILCVYFATDPTMGLLRVLWLVPIGMMGLGLVATQSRGGLLAAGAAMMVWLTMKYGRSVAIALGALAACAAPVAMGRLADIDLSDGTGQQRIQLWAEGLAQIKSPKILFGIGEGTYVDVADYVAHNSYVHSYVELGLFGGTFFFGCFFFPAYAFFAMKRDGIAIEDFELQRLFPYVPAIMAGWMMGLCSLSRCYTPSTYMIIGMGASYMNLVGFYRSTPHPVITFDQANLQRLVACSVCLLAGCFVFVRLFANFG